jgi:beta-glucosidase
MKFETLNSDGIALRKTGWCIGRFLLAALVAAALADAQATGKNTSAAAARPWMNQSLSPEERASLVLEQMTLDEKIQLVHGIGWGPLRPGSPVPPDNNGGAGEVVGIPRLGIPDLNLADSAVGIRMAAEQSRYATLLPSVLGLAASWDTTAAELYGDVIGRELRAQGYNHSIGGGVNLARDPRNGRLFEYAGEDPVLAGYMVGHIVDGIQRNQVMADMKHYALNDQETGRTLIDVHLDHKAARESDLLAFELANQIGHPASVMCSYNLYEGDWACENDWLLNHVLKGEWHYPGFVLSDWDATHSTVKAANAGLDMEQPSDIYFGAKLKSAVEKGDVPEARLNDMVRRVLRSMFAAGVVDHPPKPRFVVDPFQGRDDALHIAQESIVLLKNDGILPIEAHGAMKIAVIGAHADVGIMSGGGSAQVDAPGGNAIAPPGTPTQWQKPVYFRSPPLRYIREHASQAEVRFDAGTDVSAAAKLASASDIAIVFADQYMSEGRDAMTLSLPANQDALIEAVAKANPRTIVVLVTGNPVTMPWESQVKGIVQAWYPGIAGGEAIADVLFGDANPSGKLPITYPRTVEGLPHPEIFGVKRKEGATGLPENWSKGRQNTPFRADYTEGARVGYKWFDSEKKQPLFSFGFGLSYTTFQYSGLHVDPAQKTVFFQLENTGKRGGAEIAQVYVRLPSGAGEKFNRLAGWQRVELPAGERKQVTIRLEPLALAAFDTTNDRWSWPEGEYSVQVGGSSRDLPLSASFTISGGGK